MAGSWLIKINKSLFRLRQCVAYQPARYRPLVEVLEGRVLLTAPTVSSTVPSLLGNQTVLTAGVNSLNIVYSSAVVGGNLASSYDLRNLGPDGLSGTADDVQVPITVTFAGTTATVSFATLPASPCSYQFTIFGGNVTNSTSTPLDGTGTGTPGSNFVRDFTIVPAAASHFVFGGFPASVMPGVENSFTVTAVDPYGNVATGFTGTVYLASSDENSSFQGARGFFKIDDTYTFTSADAGTHTFAITMRTAGTQSITAKDLNSPSIIGADTDIVVNPSGVLKGLFLDVSSDNVTAGVAFSVTVYAKDTYFSLDTGYTGTVHFSSSDPDAILPADYTFTAADAGEHTFNVTMKTIHVMTISVGGVGSPPAATKHVTVSPVATRFVVSGVPVTTAAGTGFEITVTAEDNYGSVATGYTGTVQFTSTDPLAKLPADYTFTVNDEGRYSFPVTLKTAGSQSFTVTDRANSALTAKETVSVIGVTAGHFVLTPILPNSGPCIAGVVFGLRVTVVDPYGNVATGYTGTVHFTANATASIPPDYTFTAADAGVHIFNVAFFSAGYDQFIAADTVTGKSDKQDKILVHAAPAASIRISDPISEAAGVAFNITVTVVDQYGNIVRDPYGRVPAAGYTDTFHFISTDPLAVLPADYTFTPGNGGHHTFSVTLKSSGNQGITLTDTANSAVTSTPTFNVSPKPASQFAVSIPTTIHAGTAFNVTVTAEDKYGNVAPGYTGTVQLTSEKSDVTLPASYTFTAADAGVHVFSVILRSTGEQSITATDIGNSKMPALKTQVLVSPGAASYYVLSIASFAAKAGTAFNVTVTVKDMDTNIDTDYTGTVHFSSSDGAAVLPADYTFTAADLGVHTFSIILKTAGTQSIMATDAANSSVTGSQSGIEVSAAAASSFVIDAPAIVTPGRSFDITVTAMDSYGNVAVGYTGTIEFTSSDGAAVLPANYAFTSVNGGIQTFSVTLDATGLQSIAAMDIDNGSIMGSKSGIDVRL